MSSFDSSSMEGATGVYPWFWGSYWLGPNVPPPLPSYFGMIDRLTGKTWYLVLNAAGDHLQLTDTKPTAAPVKVWQPFDGPFIGAAQFRLGVSNAHLVVDTYPYEGPGPFVRQVGAQTFIAGVFAMNRDGKANFFDHLAFQQGTIRTVHTPTEPAQIPPVVTYQTYYTELQDSPNLP